MRKSQFFLFWSLVYECKKCENWGTNAGDPRALGERKGHRRLPKELVLRQILEEQVGFGQKVFRVEGTAWVKPGMRASIQSVTRFP